MKHQPLKWIRSASNGNAIAEFALSLPFMMLVLYGSVDLGRALNAYYGVTRVVYEGSRYAAAVSSLEIGEFDGTGPVPLGHQQIRDRVNLLLVRYKVDLTGLRPDYLVTERIAFDPPERDQVRVRLVVRFDSMFPLFENVITDLGTEAHGPYLY